MTIEFEIPKPIAQQQYVLKTVAENMMRSVSREMDENEHEIPYGYIEFMHTAMKATGAGSLAPKSEKRKKIPTSPNVRQLVTSYWRTCWKCFPGGCGYLPVYTGRRFGGSSSAGCGKSGAEPEIPGTFWRTIYRLSRPCA